MITLWEERWRRAAGVGRREEGREKGEFLGAEGGRKMKAQRSLSFFKGFPLMLSLRKGFFVILIYLLIYLFLFLFFSLVLS